ncbi:MAG: hypothetical protein RI885_2520 [Actinomycetota bacterium]
MTDIPPETPAPTPVRSAPTSGLTPAVAVAIVVTVLAWASAFIVIRAVGPFFSGGSLALGRLLVGAVFLSALVIGRPWIKPDGREWALIVGFGVAWFAAYNVALNIAEQTLDAGTTAMLVNIGPILIAVGAGLLLGEGIPTWLAIGAGVAFVGVVLIGIATGAGFGDGTGVLWCLLAAVTYAAGVLMQKPALRRLPAAQVTWLGCVIGAIACLPFARTLVDEALAAPVTADLGVLYLGAVPTALGFTAWGFALSRMPAGQLGVSTYIVPPVAIVLGLVFLGEVPPALALVGGAVCLGGVALSRRRSVPRTP